MSGMILHGGVVCLLKWFKKIRGGADPRFHEDKPAPKCYVWYVGTRRSVSLLVIYYYISIFAGYRPICLVRFFPPVFSGPPAPSATP